MNEEARKWALLGFAIFSIVAAGRFLLFGQPVGEGTVLFVVLSDFFTLFLTVLTGGGFDHGLLGLAIKPRPKLGGFFLGAFLAITVVVISLATTGLPGEIRY